MVRSFVGEIGGVVRGLLAYLKIRRLKVRARVRSVRSPGLGGLDLPSAQARADWCQQNIEGPHVLEGLTFLAQNLGGSQEENRISEATGGNCGQEPMNERM